jgi:hypothetical protein
VTSITVPLQAYVEIDPGVSITPNFEMYNTKRGSGPTISFAATVASRIVRDPLDDEKRTEEYKRQHITVMPLTFPPHAVVEASR